MPRCYASCVIQFMKLIVIAYRCRPEVAIPMVQCHLTVAHGDCRVDGRHQQERIIFVLRDD